MGGPTVPSEHGSAEAAVKLGGDAPQLACVGESDKENSRPSTAGADAEKAVSSMAAPRPLESANIRVTGHAAKPPAVLTQGEVQSEKPNFQRELQPVVQKETKLHEGSTAQDPTSTVLLGKRTSKELPPALKESLKQATVEFVRDAVGGIACASLSSGVDADGVLFSLDKALHSFSLTQNGKDRTYPLVDIREILIGKDSARFLANPVASTLREDELTCVVDIQLTSGADEHLFLDNAPDAYRFVQAMSVLRLYRGSQR